MLKHPVSSIKLMLGNIFALDNFRNLGSDITDKFFFGNLMSLNLAHLGILGDKWSAVLVAETMVLLLYKDPEENGKCQFNLLDKFIIFASLAGTIILIWLALYLDFTPVGAEIIAGVQARYYMPLIYLGALCFQNRKIKINWDKQKIQKSAIGVIYILGFVLMYEGVLSGRLL